MNVLMNDEIKGYPVGILDYWIIQPYCKSHDMCSVLCISIFQNFLIKTSTWFTVIMSLSRYYAICHPLKARQYVSPKYTLIAIACCVMVWTLLHLPLWWTWKVRLYNTQYFSSQRKLRLLIKYNIYIYIYIYIYGIYIYMICTPHCIINKGRTTITRNSYVVAIG